MAHHIDEEFDSAIRFKGAPESWHKLEEVSNQPITRIDQMPKIACPIVLEPVKLPDNYVMAGNSCKNFIVAKHPHRNVVITTASDNYVPFGNDELFEQVMEAFARHNIPAELSFALTMDRMSKISYCFQLRDHKEFFVGTDDAHQLYFNVYGGHDKTLGVNLFGSVVRTVCYNTVQLALRNQRYMMDAKFFHDQKGKETFKELPTLIEATLHHRTAYSTFAEQLGNCKSITLEQAKVIALQMLDSMKSSVGKDVVSTQTVNAAEAIANLFKNGEGNNGHTMYDFWNGVTQYFTKGDGSGKDAKTPEKAYNKMVSADFGNAASKKTAIMRGLQRPSGDVISDDEIDNLIKKGEKLLREHELAKA